MEKVKEKFRRIVDSQISQLEIKEQLSFLSENFEAVCFSTSFSYEDQAITHMLRHEKVKFFTLDTGRLFEETYRTWAETITKFKINIEAYFPDQAKLTDFVLHNGPNSFYNSVENRKECCYIRKVIPLKAALKNQEIWITGLRAEHSPERKNLEIFEWDEENNVIKYHPLLHWSTEEVVNYIKKNSIPYNKLHDQGYVSIGCSSCTRAVKEGESFRAGRWWWEEETKKECGLHFSK